MFQLCDSENLLRCKTRPPPKADIDVKHVILVLSGKGGVGKSTVSVNLAYALSGHGYKVGLLDLDINGPNIPKMLGIEDHKLSTLGNRIEPVHVTGALSVISMAFLLPDKSTPIIWRGPMKMAAINQFLSEVNWGSLDYLVVDLPREPVMKRSRLPRSHPTCAVRLS